MIQYPLTCLGGAVGTGARFAVTIGLGTLLGVEFPFGTFAVDFVGSFLMGGIMYVSTASDLVSPTLRLMLTTGFLGTYSAFNNETVSYLQQSLWPRALANVGLTLIVCLAAGFAGVGAARRLVG